MGVAPTTTHTCERCGDTILFDPTHSGMMPHGWLLVTIERCPDWAPSSLYPSRLLFCAACESALVRFLSGLGSPTA